MAAWQRGSRLVSVMGFCLHTLRERTKKSVAASPISICSGAAAATGLIDCTYASTTGSQRRVAASWTLRRSRMSLG